MKTSNLDPAALVAAHLTGPLKHNSRTINEQAVRELVAKNAYWSLGITAITSTDQDTDEVLAIVVASLGLTMAEFQADANSSINPDVSATQLAKAVDAVAMSAANGETIVFATGHPGSLAETYVRWGQRVMRDGGTVYKLPNRISVGTGRFLDQVGGVIMLSDEGTLLHSHEAAGFGDLLEKVKPAWVVADHGFAAAAINAGIPTVSIFDTDDSAIPLAAQLLPDIIAIPLNDNQTNVLTASAIDTFLESRDDK